MTKKIKGKSLLVVASFLLVIVAVVSAVSISGNKIQYNVFATDRLQLAPSYDDLEVVSDIIIKATVVPDKENKIIEADDGTEIFGYTVTQLNISEVFKGDVIRGETITITEEYYTLANNSNLIYTQGNYMPAQENGEYIFFLKAYDATSSYADMYFPVDLEYGKYSVSLASEMISLANASTEELEIISSDDRYVQFATKVIENYLQQ